jgi:hypothetical protein
VKILRDTLELAVAAGKESETALWLVGDRDVITDVVVAYADDPERCAIPVGMHRYGNVVSKGYPFRGPGYNLIVDDGGWRFVDDCNDEVAVEVVDSPEEK